MSTSRVPEDFYENVDTWDLETMVSFMDGLRTDLDQLGEQKTSMQKAYDFLRVNKIPDRMDEQGITNITYDDIGRVSLTSDIRASILKANREKVYKWLEKQGYGDLVVETINSGTLKAFCKKRIKDGKELPDDLFNVSPFSRASITKVRN